MLLQAAIVGEVLAVGHFGEWIKDLGRRPAVWVPVLRARRRARQVSAREQGAPQHRVGQGLT